MLNELMRVVEKLISPEEIARLPEQLRMSPAEALDYWRLQVPCYLADPERPLLLGVRGEPEEGKEPGKKAAFPK